jgi:hypothetical protein
VAERVSRRVTRVRSDLCGGEPHVDLRPDAHVHGAAVGVELEVDALALAEGLEQRVLERVRGEGELGAVGLPDHEALTRERVVHAHDTLHGRP